METDSRSEFCRFPVAIAGATSPAPAGGSGVGWQINRVAHKERGPCGMEAFAITAHRYYDNSLPPWRSWELVAGGFSRGADRSQKVRWPPYFLRGKDGANPRLAVNWYSRKNLNFLYVYQVVLRGVRNKGVQVISPRNSDWFATIPAVVRGSGAKPGIRLWSDRDGKQLPVHFPILRSRHTSAFCNSSTLAWVAGGSHIHLAQLGAKPFGRPTINTIALGQGPLRAGSISPDGKWMLLLGRRNKHFPGLVKVILAPASGAGTMRVARYLRTGDVICAPAFSPNSQLAAFALIWVRGRFFGGIDLFLVRPGDFSILRWAEIPAVLLPKALTFSPHGRQLALTTAHLVFLFDIPTGWQGHSYRALPLSKLKRIRMP